MNEKRIAKAIIQAWPTDDKGFTVSSGCYNDPDELPEFKAMRDIGVEYKKIDMGGVEMDDKVKEIKPCEQCKYCRFPRSSCDNGGSCKCKIAKYKTIDVYVGGGETPSWCPLFKKGQQKV